MLSIACLSQKGGVGKSTISQLIAVTYAQSKWRVKIADFNVKQKTSTDWAALRMSQEVAPEIAAEAFTNVAGALKQKYDLMVFDGRPDADAVTHDIAKAADLIVIPTSTTVADMVPQVKFAHELKARSIQGKKILFVINMSLDSPAAVQEARDFIEGAGYKVVGTDLPSRQSYQNAQNLGRALTETTFPTLNDRAAEVAAEIVSTASALTEKKR